MTVQLTPRPRRARPHRFTTDAYEQMIAAGILTPDDRVELRDGVIVQMAAMGVPHASCVSRLTKLLIMRLSDTATIMAQTPLRLNIHWEPEPDVMVLRPPDSVYETQRPTAADVLLLIEVADSTLDDDRRVKAPQYARAGIPELWIVNLAAKSIEVYTAPQEGRYSRMHERRAGDVLQPPLLAPLAVRVEEIVR